MRCLKDMEVGRPSILEFKEPNGRESRLTAILAVSTLLTTQELFEMFLTHNAIRGKSRWISESDKHAIPRTAKTKIPAETITTSSTKVDNLFAPIKRGMVREPFGNSFDM